MFLRVGLDPDLSPQAAIDKITTLANIDKLFILFS
jgi:hypothetical protein